VRYWKGTYDDDSERNRQMRSVDESSSGQLEFDGGDERHALQWFHLVVALQGLILIVAGLLIALPR
jgi:hypothetical protein